MKCKIDNIDQQSLVMEMYSCFSFTTDIKLNVKLAHQKKTMMMTRSIITNFRSILDFFGGGGGGYGILLPSRATKKK